MGDYGLWLQSSNCPILCRYFYNNCFKNGILPIKLSESQVDELFSRTAAYEGYNLTVDLENNTLSDEYGLVISFELDEHRRQFLLQGLDDIGLTLQHADEIAAYEERHAAKLFS